MSSIRFENVDFAYGKKPVLNNLSLNIKRDGFTALLGANGAGKSTIFNLIAGILVPDSGRVIANERHSMAKMGFVFQENTLDLELSVQQNIRYFAGLFGLKDYKPRAEALLTEFGLWEQRSEKAASSNGGHRRRLEIARAMLPEPNLLILDEPTSGLDPSIRREISNNMHTLAANDVKVIWITHLLDEIEDQDEVILLEQGQIREQATFAELGGIEGIKSQFVPKETVAQL